MCKTWWPKQNEAVKQTVGAYVQHKMDNEAAKQLVQSETRKLHLLESRMEIYETFLMDLMQVACNEMRLAANRTSRNERPPE